MKTTIKQVEIESYEGALGKDMMLITRNIHGVTFSPMSDEFKCSEDELCQIIDALIAFKVDESNLGG